MVYSINHEDIKIESAEPLSWSQRYDHTLNYDNLYINSESYTDYRPTQLQFHLSSATSSQYIKVQIPYLNRLTLLHLEHVMICRYSAPNKQWIKVNHDIDHENGMLEFQSNVIGVYTVFVNHYWYSSFTQRMADEYPNWTKVRNTKESTGQLFLNYFGIELETVQSYLEWIHDQKYIQSADIHTLDWVYMYQVPEIKITDTLQVLKGNASGFEEIPLLEELKDFFFNDQNKGVLPDFEESKLYSTKNYGSLIINITRDGKKQSHSILPVNYHIWNTFDEFAMLVGIKRLHLEINKDFKERILDVFRYPAGSHDIGLTNGIAQELNLIQRKDESGKQLVWTNDSKNLYLRNAEGKIIDVQTLRIDDAPLDPSEYRVDELGGILVYAKNTGSTHTISFIYGIQKYQLYDASNQELYKLMYHGDGQATSKLLTWVEYINTVAPVMWDRFNWDEGFWDTIDKELTGLGYVPNMWDSDITSWKDYVFESDR